MKFKIFVSACLLAIIVLGGLYYWQVSKKCDTYNVAVGRYDDKGIGDVLYIRMCKDSLGEFKELIDTMDYALNNK